MKKTTIAALAVMVAASALIAFSGLVLADGGMQSSDASSTQQQHMGSEKGCQMGQCSGDQNACQNQACCDEAGNGDCDRDRLMLQHGTCAQDQNCLQDGNGPQYKNQGTVCPNKEMA